MRYRKATSARELKISGLDLSHPTICCSLCLADSVCGVSASITLGDEANKY